MTMSLQMYNVLMMLSMASDPLRAFQSQEVLVPLVSVPLFFVSMNLKSQFQRYYV